MREIKFRAIWNQNGYWYTAFSEQHSNLSQFFAEVLQLEIEHQPVHVMQFTGLLDKVGKEIYEGDMVKSSYIRKSKYVLKDNTVVDSKAVQKFRPKLIEWRDGGFNIRDGKNLEVIGNIYENKELLLP